MRRILRLLPPLLTLVLLNMNGVNAQETRPVITAENAARLTQEQMLGHGQLTRLAWSPDGNMLAAAGGPGIWLIDLQNPVAEPRLLSADTNAINDVTFSPDGKWLASVSLESARTATEQITKSTKGAVRLWEVASGETIKTFPVEAEYLNSADGVAFRPDNTLLVAGFARNIYVWDVASGRQIVMMEGHGQNITDIAFSPDGRWLASGAVEETARLWNTATWQQHGEPIPCNHGTCHVAFNAESTIIYTGASNGIYGWGVPSLQQVSSVEDEVYELTPAFSVSSGGILAYTRNRTGIISLRDMNRRLETTLTEKDSHIGDMVFSPDGEQLAFWSFNDGVEIWNILTGEQRTVITGIDVFSASLVFSSDDKWLVSSNEGDKIHLWDSESWALYATIEGDWVADISFLAFSNNNDALLYQEGQELYIWNIAQGSKTRVTNRQMLDGFASTADFWLTPTGILTPVSSGSVLGPGDGTMRLVDMLTGQEKMIWYGTQVNGASTTAFSPDMALMASGGLDPEIHMWDVAQGETIYTLPGHITDIRQLIFSADGKLLASGSGAYLSWDDDTIRLWNVADGSEYAVFHVGRAGINTLDFTPNNTVLASGMDSYAGFASWMDLWDVAKREKLLTLPGHPGGVADLKFNHAGTLMVSGGVDGTIRLWSVPQ